MVGDSEEWIVDIRVSHHFYNNKYLFKGLESIIEGKQVFMGNSNVSEVRGRGKVKLMLYSEKKLLLQNLLYVHSLHRNLIFRTLMNKTEIKLVFESNRLVMTRRRKYLGKGYLRGRLLC